jgi:hypothetical protein
VISEFGGSFQFTISGLDVLFGRIGVATEFIFIFPLSFIGFPPSFSQIVLSRREVRMLLGVDVFRRALREQHTSTNQSSRQQTRKKNLSFHGRYSPELDFFPNNQVGRHQAYCNPWAQGNAYQ